MCFPFSLLMLLHPLMYVLIHAVDAIDMPLLNAYFHSIGAPSFQKGCNFAAAGSTILPATAASVSPFSFGIQVAQFFQFKNQVLQLLTKGTCYYFFMCNDQEFVRHWLTWENLWILIWCMNEVQRLCSFNLDCCRTLLTFPVLV